jgi:hypothetical protein
MTHAAASDQRTAISGRCGDLRVIIIAKGNRIMEDRLGFRMARTAIAVALLLWAGAPAFCATCPSFDKKSAIVGSQTNLPDGFIVYGLRSGNGIYRSSLRQFAQTLIPNTGSDRATYPALSADGAWLVYAAQTSLYVIGVDGAHRTKVPTATISVSSGMVCGVYRQSPKGTEIFYKETDTRLRAVAVTWSANGPTFGADRLIGQFSNTILYSIGVAKNHIFTRLGIRSQFATIPDAGNGTAGDNTEWQFTGAVDQGCEETISFDGRICCHNPGLINQTDCIPNELGSMRHKGFVLLPFKENTAPSLDWTTFVMNNALSVNWCPVEYRIGSLNDIDFGEWNYTNDTSYIAGSLKGALATIKGVWLVHWPSNTWTMLTGAGVNVAFPAVCITGAVNVSRPAIPTRNERISGACGDRLTFDIRGRGAPSRETSARPEGVRIMVRMNETGAPYLLLVGP